MGMGSSHDRKPTDYMPRRKIAESPYSDEPDVADLRFIRGRKKHLLLEKPIPFDNPVIPDQGKQDQKVPWALTQRLPTS